MGEDAVNEEVETAEDAGETAAPAEEWTWGTGRRKTSVARVRVRAGSGEIRVNKRTLEEYFPTERLRGRAVESLKTVKLAGRVDVFVNVSGGGTTGQAEAMLMGLARALVRFDPATAAVLRPSGHLTRDSRMVERKKYGRKGARRRFQYSKR